LRHALNRVGAWRRPDLDPCFVRSVGRRFASGRTLWFVGVNDLKNFETDGSGYVAFKGHSDVSRWQKIYRTFHFAFLQMNPARSTGIANHKIVKGRSVDTIETERGKKNPPHVSARRVKNVCRYYAAVAGA
jgi:hypothetical protein